MILMSQNRRIQKVSSLLKKEVSLIFNNDLEDRLISENFISITSIELSADLYYCKIYITCSADEDNKREIVEFLNRSKNFIRHKLSQRIELRRIPELHFKIDKELEKGISVLKILDKLRDKSNNT